MTSEIVVTAVTTIAAPAARVWSVLADYRYDWVWRVGVAAMTQDTPGVVVAGTVTTEQFTMLGQRMTNIASISDVHPGRSFAWRTTSGTDAEGTRTVDPVDATTTRVTLVTRSRPRGALEKLLRPLIAPTLQRSLDRSLVQLREWLEKSA